MTQTWLTLLVLMPEGFKCAYFFVVIFQLIVFPIRICKLANWLVLVEFCICSWTVYSVTVWFSI